MRGSKSSVVGSSNEPAFTDYLKILNNFSISVMVIDRSGTILFANSQLLQELGITSSGLDNLSLSAILPTIQLETLLTATKPVLANLQQMSGKQLNVCLLARHLSDTQFLLELTPAADTISEKVNHQAQSILQTAINCSTDAVFISDGEGNIIDFNEAFTSFYRFSDRKEIAKTLAEYQELFDVYWPDGRPTDMSDWAVSRALSGESARNAEYQLVQKETGDKWVGSFSFSPIRNNAGSITGSVVVSRDITTQSKLQQEVLENKQRFEMAFEHSTIGMCLNDLSGRFLDVNQTMLTMFERPRSDFINTHFDQFTYKDDLEVGHEALRKMASGAIPFVKLEKRYLKSDGSLFWASVTATVLYDKNHGPKYIFTQIVDIHDQKMAEEQSRRHQKLLQLFVENAPAAIAMFDREMRFLSVSNRFFADYHMTASNIIGKTYYEIFPEIPDRWKQIHQNCLAGAVDKCLQDPFPRADGSVDWVHWEIHPWYEQNGTIGGIILFSEVITDLVNSLEKVRTQLHRIHSLHAIDISISNSYDIKIMLDVVLQEVKSNLRVDAVDVLLYDNGTNQLTLTSEKGFQIHSQRDFSVPMGSGLAGKVAFDRKYLYIPDLNKTTINIFRSWLIGNEKFLFYYGVPLIVKGKLKGVLEVFHRSLLTVDTEWVDFLETLAGQAAIAIDNAEVYEGLRRANFNLTLAYDATIEGWSRAMDLRDKETENHTERVTELTLEMVGRFKFSPEDTAHIRRGCLLHDIGKLGVPDHILLKPGPLTDEEWIIMKRHPQLAYDMLTQIDYLRPALDIPFRHHEKWDGTGYPRGIKGEQIPLAARIFAVVDVWDAVTSDRPYRTAWSHEKALAYIQSQAGSHFDPSVVKVFMEVITSRKSNIEIGSKQIR